MTDLEQIVERVTNWCRNLGDPEYTDDYDAPAVRIRLSSLSDENRVSSKIMRRYDGVVCYPVDDDSNFPTVIIQSEDVKRSEKYHVARRHGLDPRVMHSTPYPDSRSRDIPDEIIEESIRMRRKEKEWRENPQWRCHCQGACYCNEY